MLRLKELEAATLAAVRVEDRPTDYIEAQAHEDGYRAALHDISPVLTLARKAADHLMNVSQMDRLTQIERRDGHDVAATLLNVLAAYYRDGT